jgi:hypothetical protein
VGELCPEFAEDGSKMLLDGFNNILQKWKYPREWRIMTTFVENTGNETPAIYTVN